MDQTVRTVSCVSAEECTITVFGEKVLQQLVGYSALKGEGKQ
jgi:hypothetical protein